MKNFLKFRFTKSNLLILAILLLGAFFRFYNINWDQNQHLHPDERFLTMVETALGLPKSLNEFLNTTTSPLNPQNRNYGFFVYGTFPIFLVKYAGELVNMSDYNQIYLVGRFLSGLFDLGTVFLLFLIGKKIKDDKTGLIAAFFYSSTVLAIQLSHFFTVDTFLNFFIVLSFYFLITFLFSNNLIIKTIPIGLSLGLAMACKINAILFLPMILLGILFKFILKFLIEKKKIVVVIKLFVCFLLFASSCYFSFRFFQPYTFADNKLLSFNINPLFITNLKELSNLQNPNTTFPPSIQWISTKPYLFPLNNLLYWGMGLPLGVISLLGLIFSIFTLFNSLIVKRKFLNKNSNNLLPTDLELKIGNFVIILWIVGFFVYQGNQFVKSIRYFIIIYPFLFLLASLFINGVLDKIKSKRILFVVYCLFLTVVLIYPLAFMSIYARPITRISASEWIYKNIPPNKTLAWEYWDDPLPLQLILSPHYSYKTIQLSPYDLPDNEEKISRLMANLKKTDYIILSSNRLYGSIPKAAALYPLTSKYYRDLFEEKLGFRLVKVFTSRPKFLFWEINDDNAEEAFTVNDHPKVIILKRNS